MMSIRNLKFQESFGGINADQLVLHINLDANLFGQRDEMFAPASLSLDDEQLDAARSQHFAHAAQRRALNRFNPASRQFPVVILVFRKDDAIGLRHGELASDKGARLFDGIEPGELEHDAASLKPVIFERERHAGIVRFDRYQLLE